MRYNKNRGAKLYDILDNIHKYNVGSLAKVNLGLADDVI